MSKYISLETLYMALAEIDRQAIKGEERNVKCITNRIRSIRFCDETKHGEWKIDGFVDLDDGTSQMIVRCSVCGNTQGVLSNYCPNCGASMMGGDGE